MKARRLVALAAVVATGFSTAPAAVTKPRARLAPVAERVEAGSLRSRIIVVGGVAVIALIGGLILVTSDGSRPKQQRAPSPAP